MVIEKNGVSFDVTDSGVLEKVRCCIGGNVTIPRKLPNGLIIREIASCAFCGVFNRISISNGIKIRSGAFKNARVDVVVWNDCPIIPFNCFEGSSIKKIHNILHVREVEAKAFYNCEILSMVWPQECDCIPKCCFADSDIEKISNIDHVQSVGEGAFYRSCLKSISWPSKCSTIPPYCFAYSSVDKIRNIKHVTEIERGAFLESELNSFTVPLGVSALGENAFGRCKLLESVLFHTKYTTIPDGCFEECWALTKVDRINNVVSIGARAFKGCCCLTEITWPSKCLDIPYSCFDGCLDLIRFDMPMNIKSVGELAFRNTGIQEIVWPDGCNLIPYGCFQFSAIKRLSNISSVVQIDKEAFSYAKYLTLDLTECPISHIGPRAFEHIEKESILAPYYMDDAEFSMLF